MRIGFIGGTAFVGRHMVERAIAQGHEVTVFHRGRTGASLFPEAEHVLGDRTADLGLLRGRALDAVIDVCGYVPREVHAVADVLGDEIGRYLYVSSVSAYRPDAEGPLDEHSPLFGPDDLDDPATEAVDAATYGPLEGMCETAAVERFADRAVVVRPTYVVGPHDRSDRFTWWVRRCASGGPVLAVGPADAPVQFIDARDLAAFAVGLVETGASGIFNGVGPAVPTTWAELLDRCLRSLGRSSGAEAEVVWADAVRVRELDVEPEVAFPMWSPTEFAGVMRCSPAKSLAAGLSLRPVEETVCDLDTWDAERGRPPLVAGASPTEIDRLLAVLR